MNYNIVIGLEIHNELKTKSKVFCGCPAEFSKQANINCCPACSGFPGALPVLNAKAVEYTIRAGLALGCDISEYAQFDRKNYYYPDLARAYQISQLSHPVCKHGGLSITTEGFGERFIRLNRIHLEEDAGKLVHSGSSSLVDYNRSGMPLIEIVTEPDLKGAEEAIAFLEKLKQILKYVGISDCKMEEGSLRCDVNISLNREGEPFGVRTEMKNLASFKAVNRAIMYESKRQAQVLDSGEKVKQETRRWDDETGRSYPMRSKEDAQDYRYFPDPDLVPITISRESVTRIKESMPLLPEQRIAKYVSEYNLPEYDAKVLTADAEIADFFDECARLYNNPKGISNWIMTEVLRRLKDSREEDIIIPILPKNFVEILQLLASNTINQNGAKAMFDHYFESDEKAAPIELVERLGLRTLSDTGEIEGVLKDIIEKNPAAVADYKSGNTKAKAFFVGQTMKATKGKADPNLVNSLIDKLI